MDRDYPTNALNQGQARVDRPMSRIDNDVMTVKGFTQRTRDVSERIIRHAQTLGYYNPQPSTSTTGPTPIITTLSDALMELDRAMDELSGALNLFD